MNKTDRPDRDEFIYWDMQKVILCSKDDNSQEYDKPWITVLELRTLMKRKDKIFQVKDPLYIF